MFGKGKKGQKNTGKVEEQSEKPAKSRKKILIIGGAALAVVLAGAVFGMGYLKKMRSEPVETTAYQPPEYDEYVLGEDKIASFTKINGFRELKDASGPFISFVAPEKDEEGNYIPPKETKAPTPDESAAALVVEEKKDPKVTYEYDNNETTPADVKAYVEYLLATYDFKEEFPYYLDNPAGFISLKKDAIRGGFNLILEIDYNRTDCVITMEQVKKPKEDRKQQQQAAQSSSIGRVSAIEVLQQLDPIAIGLTGAWADYSLIGEEGHVMIADQDCYGIRVYQEMPDYTTRIMGIYYVAADRTSIYKYDPLNDDYTQIQ